MNNMERIALARLVNNIPEDVVVESFAEWNRREMKIKKDEHPVFRIQIWVPKDKDTREEEETSDRMNLWWTNFFTEEQVEPMTEEFKERLKKGRKKKST